MYINILSRQKRLRNNNVIVPIAIHVQELEKINIQNENNESELPTIFITNNVNKINQKPIYKSLIILCLILILMILLLIILILYTTLPEEPFVFMLLCFVSIFFFIPLLSYFIYNTIEFLYKKIEKLFKNNN